MDCEEESANLSLSNDRRSQSESHQLGTLAKEAIIPASSPVMPTSSQNNVVIEKLTQ